VNAIQQLSHGFCVQAQSSLYKTAPVGGVVQPDFINAVVMIVTSLLPQDLLARLLTLEKKLGRVRDGVCWGARVIDLDLLLYGDQVIDLPGLKVPHPRMCERAFVVLPLLEIASDLKLPDGTYLRQVAALPFIQEHSCEMIGV